ncbi:hypothetical protein chiPu_0029717, partial [Chiloscyllium punctatum]|nr:hypothetical protein [Chiloscyllium punctatum]
MYLSAETHVEDSRRLGLKRIESAASALDPESDKSHVMASNNSAFCLPAKFEFLPHDGDEVLRVLGGDRGDPPSSETGPSAPSGVGPVSVSRLPLPIPRFPNPELTGSRQLPSEPFSDV